MNAIPGPTAILDFDGTIAHLPVDWPRLRRQLGVERIADLWQLHAFVWSIVESAEVHAALVAEPVGNVLTLLDQTESFAILTSNSARSVEVFFQRYPAVRERLVAIAGRAELGGPKHEFVHFARGMSLCRHAIETHCPHGQPIYVGNERFELDFATSLGLNAIDIRELITPNAPLIFDVHEEN